MCGMSRTARLYGMEPNSWFRAHRPALKVKRRTRLPLVPHRHLRIPDVLLLFASDRLGSRRSTELNESVSTKPVNYAKGRGESASPGTGLRGKYRWSGSTTLSAYPLGCIRTLLQHQRCLGVCNNGPSLTPGSLTVTMPSPRSSEDSKHISSTAPSPSLVSPRPRPLSSC